MDRSLPSQPKTTPGRATPLVRGLSRLNHPYAYIGIGLVLVLAIAAAIAFGLGLFSSRSAEVKTTSGKVETRFGENGVFVDTQTGHKLKTGDAIRTGSDGQALLVLDDGTGIRVAEDSFLAFTRIEGAPQNPVARLALNTGKVFNILPTERSGGASYDVDTPTGVVAVRGSMMAVAYSTTAGIEAACLSGHCQVSADGKTADLTTGKAATVDAQHNISAVSDMTASQKYEWVPVIDEARAAGVAVDKAVQSGCTCTGFDLVCQDGTRVSYYPTCTNQRQPVSVIAVVNFDQGENKQAALYLVRSDGSGAQLVHQTQSPETMIWLAGWSPDGSKLAYTVENEPNSPNVGHVVNADGTNDHIIALQSDSGGLFWSPDSTQLAYWNPWATTGQVQGHVVNADGTNDQSMADPVKWWSPDGTKLIVYNDTGPFVLDLKSSHRTPALKANLVDAFAASWSPDGTQVYFVAATQALRNNTDIFRMNADGSGLTQVTHSSEVTGTSEGQASPPVWSPDGQKIAYTLGTSQLDLYVANPDGTGEVNLTNSPGFISDVNWLPDGRKLLFYYAPGYLVGQVYSINSDGTGLTQLTHSSGGVDLADWRVYNEEASPPWLPDGRIVIVIYDNVAGHEVDAINIDSSQLVTIMSNSDLPLPSIHALVQPPGTKR